MTTESQTTYLVVASISSLPGLLLIKRVDFAPDIYPDRMKIEGVKGVVTLMYQCKYSMVTHGGPPDPRLGGSLMERDHLEMFLPDADVFSRLQRYKSPLGNGLYEIALDAAIKLIIGPGADDAVEYHKGPDLASQQIRELQQSRLIEAASESRRKEQRETARKKIAALESRWKEAVLDLGRKHVLWQMAAQGKRGFFGKLTGQHDEYQKELSERIAIGMSLLKRLPQHFQLVCNWAAEPPSTSGFNFRWSEGAEAIKKQDECTALVDFRLDIDENETKFNSSFHGVGDRVNCSKASAPCRVCGRKHHLSFEPIALEYLRPTYLPWLHDTCLTAFLNYGAEERAKTHRL